MSEEKMPKVLLVDDDKNSLVALTKILKNSAVEVVTAESGQAALDLIHKHRFALVCLDINMPGMDGFETIAKIQAIESAADLPVIMITGDSSDETISAGYKAGALDYLLKPVKPEVLSAKVGLYLLLHEQKQHIQSTQRALDQLPTIGTLVQKMSRQQFDGLLTKLLSTAERAGRLAGLLIIDLDNFKFLTSNFGKKVSDELLSIVVTRLEECLRETDYVCRLGSDKFGVVLPEMTETNKAGRIAHRVQLAIAKPYQIGEETLNTTASIGIACFPLASSDSEGLYQNAENALAAVRERGGNAFQYYLPEINERFKKQLAIENELQHAITNDEFYLVYQPRYDLKTMKITGAEVLTRWKNKKLGEVPPGIFIPIAEEMDLMEQLGDWIMERACEEVKKWLAIDKSIASLVFGVNLSPYQLASSGIEETILSLFKRHDLPLKSIEFELTESLFSGNVTELEETLNNLYESGICFSIDDFGTGYSSLSRLKNLPVQALKVDRSFVMELCTNKSDASIVESILALAKALDLDTIAEGIETEEQLIALRERGCNQGQGYYMSRPIPLEEMTVLIEEFAAGK